MQRRLYRHPVQNGARLFFDFASRVDSCSTSAAWNVYLDEYRDPSIARALADQIAHRATKPWVLMEICGGQPTP